MSVSKRSWVGASALVALVSLLSCADELELANGEVLQGTLLASGPSRVLLDDSRSGPRFLARSEVSAYRVQGKPQTLPEQSHDPAALVKVVRGAVRARREGEDLEVSLHGMAAVLREGDELRTGPFGRVGWLLPTGGEALAWGDAIVGFEGGLPRLLTGQLQITNLEGRAQASFPGGLVEVMRGKLEAQRLRSQSRLQCLQGRAQVRGTEGYRLDLPRNHTATITAETSEAPASVSASNTNAWALQLELGARRIAIRRGERVILLAPVAPQLAPAPAQPAPESIPREPEPPVVAKQEPSGTVLRATGAFALSRRALPARRIEPAEAEGTELHPGDRLSSQAGEVSLLFASARVELGKESSGQVVEGGVPFRLVAGQASLQSEREASLAFPEGELGLLAGSALVRQEGGATRIGVSRGTAGARIGELVRAELLAPSELHIQRTTTGLELRSPTGASAVPLVLGGLELRLRAGEALRFAHAGGLEEVTLLNRAGAEETRIELAGVRARVISGPSESRILELLHDGRQIPLGPGTYRFVRRGQEILAFLPGHDSERSPLAAAEPGPSGAAAEATPAPLKPAEATPAPTLPATPAPDPVARAMQPSAGAVRQVLANGAVVVLRAWGPLKIKRAWRRPGDQAHMIALEGPRGELQLEPRSELHLERVADVAKVGTRDGRFVLHHPGAGAFTALIREDGVFAIQITDGDRSVEVERGVEFDMSLRADRYVLTYVFGQAVYLEPSQQMRVTRREGLRMRYARNRSAAPAEGPPR